MKSNQDSPRVLTLRKKCLLLIKFIGSLTCRLLIGCLKCIGPLSVLSTTTYLIQKLFKGKRMIIRNKFLRLWMLLECVWYYYHYKLVLILEKSTFPQNSNRQNSDGSILSASEHLEVQHRVHEVMGEESR